MDPLSTDSAQVGDGIDPPLGAIGDVNSDLPCSCGLESGSVCPDTNNLMNIVAEEAALYPARPGRDITDILDPPSDEDNEEKSDDENNVENAQGNDFSTTGNVQSDTGGHRKGGRARGHGRVAQNPSRVCLQHGTVEDVTDGKKSVSVFISKLDQTIGVTEGGDQQGLNLLSVNKLSVALEATGSSSVDEILGEEMR